MNSKKALTDRVIYFLESKAIFLIIILTFLTFTLAKILLLSDLRIPPKISDCLTFLDNILTIHLNSILVENNGALISIAAVFIGIYFTIFTILSGFKTESTFAVLDVKRFKALVRYVKNAFIGSFVYLFFSLVFNLKDDVWLINLLSLLLLCYMLLSAVRFAIIIYYILQRDIEKYHEHLEEQKKEREKYENILNKLNVFLEEDKKNKKKDKDEKLKEILLERHSKE